jgi:hypothetical protein
MSSSSASRPTRRSATRADPEGSPGKTDGADDVEPVGSIRIVASEDPTRPRGDLPPPAPITPGGAAGRSLAIPGLGLLATGDRSGAAIAVVAVAGLTLAFAIALPYAPGTTVAIPFLIGAAAILAWAGQAVASWRRAARRTARHGLEPGGALVLLAMAPLVAAGATAYWAIAGDGASPAARTAAYVTAWWDGRVESGVAAFAAPPGSTTLEAVWGRQGARLRNLALSAAAVTGPSGGIDPDRPFASIRTTELPLGTAADGGRRTFRLELVRQVAADGRVLGLPATSTRLVSVVELGTIDVVRVESAHPVGPLPPITRWMVLGFELLGESVGS